MREISLGKGRLSWNAAERRSDRYGTVFLAGNNEESSINLSVAKTLEGFQGELIAKVLETRKSTHLGDIFRGIFPRTPNVGDQIVLGRGTIFIEEESNTVMVGVSPKQKRAKDWLDPRTLYDTHQQTVELVVRI